MGVAIKESNILRTWDDIETLSDRGRLSHCYILELPDMLVQVKIDCFLPRSRICALAECSNEFAPLRKDMIYCCKKHNVRAQSLKRQKRNRERKVLTSRLEASTTTGTCNGVRKAC